MPDALHRDQAVFLDYVLGRSDEACALVVDDDRVGAARRLDIYRNAYKVSLTNVLADHYERLHRYLGEEQFGNIAAGYIRRYPSTFRNLRLFGEGFAAFLDAHFPDDREMGEIASIDWHLRSAFDAADAVPLTADAIGQMGDDWVERKLRLPPSAARITVRHNSVAIWNALEREDDAPEAVPLEEPATVLVWRKQLQPHFRTLERPEVEAVALLAQGMSFERLSGEIAQQHGEDRALEYLSAWLAKWLADELLTLCPMGIQP